MTTTRNATASRDPVIDGDVTRTRQRRAPATTMPRCFRCHRRADEIVEYCEGACWERPEFTDAGDYVRLEECTYNPVTNTFACTRIRTHPGGRRRPCSRSR